MTSKEELLDAIGLQPKRTTAESLASGAGLIALGAVVGAIAGVLLAPKSGRALREDMRTAMPERFNGGRERGQSASAN